MNDINSFGEWVKHRRKLMDLTQAQVAQRVGCAVITLKKIEGDERRPSQDMAELLAEHLAVPQSERARFFSMARGQFTSVTPSTDALHTPPFLAALSRGPASRFVGRQRELAQLQGHLDRALAGHSGIVFISGEAGRGKTTLLAEYARRAQEHRADLIVLSGMCSAQGDIGDPYLPFRDVLALLTGDLETPLEAAVVLPEQAQRLWAFLPRALRALVDHGPSLLTALVPGPEMLQRVARYTPGRPEWLAQLQEVIARQQVQPGQLQQGQIFEQMRQVLQALAAQQPILILLDDLQWIDSASLNLLFHLGRRFERDRILLAGAFRGSEVTDAHPLAPVITEFKRRFGDIQVDLEQYDPVEGRAFVDALIDTQSNRLGEHFRQQLFWHTKGYPLFTIELLRHLRERGNLVRDDQGLWVETAMLEASDLPVRIEAVINQRLNRLDPASREMLQIAAVEGEIFSAQVAAHVLRLEDRLILQRLSNVTQNHWLVREHSEIAVNGRYLSRYQFSHVLFQHYLHRQMSQGERRWAHRAVAEALIHLYQPHTDEIAVQLAHHFTQAGALTQAAAYHVMAGDRALQGAALAEASEHYRAALGNWPTEDESGRAATLRKLGECLWMAAQISAALETLQASYQTHEGLGNHIEAAAVQRVIGRVYWEQGDRATSLAHYHQALHILEREPEGVELAQAISAISQMHMLAADYEQTIVWGERALELARRLDAQEVVAHATDNIGVAVAISRDSEQGFELLRQSIKLALQLNLRHEACRAHVNLGESLTWYDRYAEAEQTFENLFAYATRSGMAVFQGVALVRLTEVEWWQGRWAEAIRHWRKLESWRAEFQGTSVPKVWASTLLGGIYNDLGRPDHARQELEQELHPARTLDEPRTTVNHLGQLARTMAALEGDNQSAAHIQELLALLRRTASNQHSCIPALVYSFRWSVHNRDHLASGPIAADSLLHLERTAAHFRSGTSIAALAEARGLEALHNGNPALAVEKFQQAAAGWAALHRLYDQVRALSDLGRVLHQTGDSARAHAAFEQAYGIVETLAGQLEEAELRASFLHSPLVQAVQSGQSDGAEYR